MTATSLDLSQIRTDALSAASTFRTLIGLGASDTPTFKAATLSAGTLNGTVLDVSQTWGGTGTYTGLRYNVTDSGPSNAASLLMDLQVGGTSKFKVDKSGSATVAGAISFNNQVVETLLNFFGGSYTLGINSWEWKAKSGGGFTLTGAAPGNLGWLMRVGTNATASLFEVGLSGEIKLTSDTILARDAANTLALRRANTAGPTTYPQAFRIYNNVDGTDAAPGSNWERAKIAWSSNVLQIGTEKLGTGAARALELQTDGTTRLTIGTTGTATFTGTISGSVNGMTLPVGGNGYNFSSGGYFVCISSGVFKFSDSADTSFNRLQLGGTTSSFPSIKRNGTAVNFRLADDSADCDVSAAHGTFSAGTDTVSTPILNLSQTWNNAATTFTGILANVTDTASNAASLLMDLQVGGSSKFNISKSGNVTVNSAKITLNGSISLQNNSGAFEVYRNSGQVFYADSSNCYIVGAFRIGLNNGLVLEQDAAGILAQRNGTNAQTYRLYNTYTDASNYERGKLEWSSNVFRIGTEKAGTGSARALELQTDGTTRLTIASTGAATATDRLTALDFLTTSDGRGFQVWQSPSGPAAIHFGMSVPGTSSGSNMWFSTTSNLNTWIGRLSISSSTGTATFYGDVQIDDAKNIVINTTTGTKIGTATTQKIGFYNATPVVQPANTTALDETLVNLGLRASGGVANFNNTLDLTIRTVTYGATMAIDASLGNKIAITLTGNGTISNPTNAVDGRVLVFRLRQDGSGNRVPVWDTKYSFVGDLATVTLSTAANKIDRIAFEYDSTDDKWYCISFIKGS